MRSVIGSTGVPERRDAQEQLRAQAAQQRAVADLGQRALAAWTLSEIFDDAVAVVARTLGVEFAKVLEVDPSGDQLRFVAGVGWDDEFLGTATVRNAPHTQDGYTLSVAEPVVVSNASEERRFQLAPLLRRHGVVTGMSVVIGQGSLHFGVLSAHTRENRPFTADDANFLQSVANVLGAAIRRDADEQRLRDAEQRYRTLVEQLPLVTWSYEAGGPGEYYVSPQIEALLGFTADEWSHEAFLRQIHPNDRLRVERAPAPRNLDFRMRHRDGRTIWIHEETVALAGEDGGVRGIHGFMVDITARMEADGHLRRSEEKFRALFDSSADAILIGGDDGRWDDANPAACELFGLTRDEIVGRGPGELVAPEQRESMEAQWARLLVDGEAKGESDMIRQDGEHRHIEYAAKANFLPGCHLSIIRNVGERKRLEAQLTQAQKMEAIGRLAGGIAHDFNNLLLVIRGYSDLLLGRVKSERELADVREIASAAERAASLTGQLLAFSRRQIVQPMTLSVNEILGDTESMLRRLLGEDVVLVRALAPDVGFVRADPGQIEQVLLNLALNARDAMPTGGTLTLEAKNVVLDEAEAQLHSVDAGDYVLLSVSDTGEGMNAATIARVFEPFFSTKSLGAGTGLGLATVYGIAQQAGGFVSVESELGAGATFEVHLPRVAAPVSEVEDEASSRASLTGTETILLLEDDARVRHLVAEMLRSFGYEVLTAKEGEHAIEIVRDGELDVDLLLTDVIMPGANGPEVAAKCTLARPSLGVLYMSGYADQAVVDVTALTAERSFLQKPFSRETLGRKLRDALDAAR